MPRYFFDIDNDVRNLRDTEGIPLVAPEGARMEALATLAELARDMLPAADNQEFKIQVRNDRGEQIYEAVLTLRGGWIP